MVALWETIPGATVPLAGFRAVTVPLILGYAMVAGSPVDRPDEAETQITVPGRMSPSFGTMMMPLRM